MSLIPYYLQYLSEICEGTRQAPEGLALSEQDDLKKALQLQAGIAEMGIPAFVRACAAQDGTEIPQSEYDSFDPAELNAAIAQLAAAAQPQETQEAPAAPAAPQEPVRTETRDIFEIFLDSVCLDDDLLTYLIDILKRHAEPEFTKLSHAAARTELKLDDFLAWLGNMELLAGEKKELLYQVCLDGKGKLLSCRCISKGSVGASPVYVRQVVENALYAGASTIILAHNHPSGVALPSDADVLVTHRIQEALAPLGIRLADHIIVADDDYVSMAESGFLQR